ncbi:MAG: FKBP-type peptidyl-prolyl cis-trans isomerase [Gammaproteobacteria bacterium]|nr:FKBP-type peptidyl-prolyl cis-trans isomerase [Gammaproteobacteria bacterium]
MTKILKFSGCVLLVSSIFSSVQAVEFDSDIKRFSYAFGYSFGQSLVEQGVEVDSDAFAAAVGDAMQEKASQLTPEQTKQGMEAGRAALAKKKEAMASAVLERGQKFLADNKAKPGVVTLENGMQYIELQAGTGEKPKATDTVTVNYRGTLIDGTEFDSSYSRGTPASFSLDGVIPGFREALSRMQPGAKWTVFLPSELAYGPKGAGQKIGPNEVLIFEMELISIGAEPASLGAQ